MGQEDSTPDAQEEAKRRLTKSQSGCPSVEVCIPDLVPEDLRRDVQTDALFREVNRLLPHLLNQARVAIRLEGPMSRSTAASFANAIRLNFEEAVEPKTDPFATTTSRAEALRSLLSSGPVFPKPYGRTSAITPCLAAFRDLERRHPRERIEDEDLRALEDNGLFP
jgi:hypothetical protein